MKTRSFCSKIILFGEYSVIQNSMALLTPYNLFEGSLSFRKNGLKVIDPELKSFAQYIKTKASKGELNFPFDVNSFEFDVAQGLTFDSSIPQGFGVGSSGALCAAIYDHYSNGEKDNISELKKNFAVLESHFHGSSSGMDPLISFLNKPILVRSSEKIEIVKIPKYEEGKGAIFLLNTGRARRTEPLVNLFLEKCSQDNFSELCQKELIPITNKCIESFLEGNLGQVAENCRELSHFQFNHFTAMIPTLFRDLWQQGLKSEDYLLKLCGAGGGGFILGFTKDFEKAAKSLKQVEVRPLFRFDV
jgi:mevalonate kinase